MISILRDAPSSYFIAGMIRPYGSVFELYAARIGRQRRDFAGSVVTRLDVRFPAAVRVPGALSFGHRLRAAFLRGALWYRECPINVSNSASRDVRVILDRFLVTGSAAVFRGDLDVVRMSFYRARVGVENDKQGAIKERTLTLKRVLAGSGAYDDPVDVLAAIRVVGSERRNFAFNSWDVVYYSVFLDELI